MGRSIQRTCSELDNERSISAIYCHNELDGLSDGKRIFIHHFHKWEERCISSLAGLYADLVKLAWANPSDFGANPQNWAREQLRDAELFVTKLVRYWIYAACSGSDPADSEPWHAPGWLFEIGWHVGVGPQPMAEAERVDRNQPLDLVWSERMVNGRVWLFQQRLNFELDKTADSIMLQAAQAVPHGAGFSPPARPARKSKTRRLTSQELEIADVIRMGKTGAAYARELDERQILPLRTWPLADRWPGWEIAYKRYPHIRKLIQDQKHRIAQLAGIRSRRTRLTRSSE